MPPARGSLADHLPGLLGPSRRAAWRRVLLRRGLAAALLILALHLATSAVRGPTDGRPVVVATTDLPAGALVEPADLTVRAVRGDAPAGAALDPAELVGRPASVAIGAGEVLTPERVTGPSGLPPGHRALALPLLTRPVDLSPGDRVDVYRAGHGEPVAADAIVLGAGAGPDATLGGEGDLPSLVVALDEAGVGAVTTALGEDASGSFVVALRGGSQRRDGRTGPG